MARIVMTSMILFIRGIHRHTCASRSRLMGLGQVHLGVARVEELRRRGLISIIITIIIIIITIMIRRRIIMLVMLIVMIIIIIIIIITTM